MGVKGGDETRWGEMEGGGCRGVRAGAEGFSHREKNLRFRQKINSAELQSTSAEP